MRAHLRLPILLLFVLSGCLSCSREAPFTPVECQYFVEETFSRDVSFDDVFRSIKKEYEAVGVDADAFISKYDTEIRMVRLLSQPYAAHGITYHTVDVEGNPVIASGVVYYPKTGASGFVVELSPHNEWKGGCVTKNPMPSELAMAMRGQVCLIPDLVGFGSTEEYPIAFLQHDNIARVSADLRAAAGEFIHNKYHFDISRSSVIWGYSLSGSAALALERFYQFHPERNVRVKTVYSGGGLYDFGLAFAEIMEKGELGYALMPSLLYSLNHYARLNFDFDVLFKEPLREHVDDWAAGFLPADELCGFIGTRIADYIDMDHFSPGCPMYDDYIAAAAGLKIPFDWVPSCPVRLFHAGADETIPRTGTDNLAAYLKEAGADVTYIVEEDVTHREMYFVMCKDFIANVH